MNSNLSACNPLIRTPAHAALTLTAVGSAAAADPTAAGGGAGEGSLWASLEALFVSWTTDPASREMLEAVLLAAGALILLVLVFYLTRRLLDRACARLESWRGTRISGLRIQTYELMSADRITELLKTLARGLRVAALFVVLYVSVPLILSFFPWTRDWIVWLYPYLMAPVYALVAGFVEFLPNLISIVIILVATRYLIRLTRALFAEVAKQSITFPGFHPEWAQPTAKLLSLLIVVFAVVLISPYLPGFGSPAFQGVSIFLGVLLSLGSTAAIANIVAGTALTYMRAFKVGDRVQIADTLGDVLEKTLLVTRLRTVKNVEVTIPNALVLGGHMINFSAEAEQRGLILHTAVTIGYDVPWRKVRELLIAAAGATGYVKQEPPPFVLQTALNDYSIAYEINVYTGDPARSLEIVSELHANIQDRFNDAGVEILSPAYAALRDGNQPAVPTDYLPKGGEAKGFRLLPLPSAPKPGE